MLEPVSTSSSLELPKKRCSELQLSSEKLKQSKRDKPELDAIQRGEWLTDTHISTVNEILKKQFPSISGLQNPVYGQNLSFKRLNGPFIQILHTDGNHWLAVEGVHGSFVRVYDSRKQSISQDTQMQIANLIVPSEKAINVHVPVHTIPDWNI